MKEYGGIYKITNLITGDSYIGQSIHIRIRKRIHFSDLRLNKHGSPRLQNAYNKYGKENFKFEVILYCEPFELTRYETFFDKKYKDLGLSYNIRDCVDSNKGHVLSNETKTIISNKLKIIMNSQENKDRMAKVHLGRTLSTETKEKISKSNKGRICSEEVRKNMSKAQKGLSKGIGHITSQETKEKISKTLMGHPVSEETRAKISKANRRK